MANLISLRTARRSVLGEKIAGAVVYCSDQAHSSVDRALQLLGFEAAQLRKLPSDHSFRLSVARLKQEVASDRAAGRVPFCVIANAGATNTGIVDPLIETAELCKKKVCGSTLTEPMERPPFYAKRGVLYYRD